MNTENAVVSGRILVVDDDLELCQVIVDTLKEKGYDATFVQTAEEGLDHAVGNLPDLILTDLEIPRMGGLVLCQKLKTHPKTNHIPIIIITVRDSHFDKQTAISLGADQYITKPFRRSQLLQEVAELISASQSDWIHPSSPHTTKISVDKNISEPSSAVPLVSPPVASLPSRSVSSPQPSAPIMSKSPASIPTPIPIPTPSAPSAGAKSPVVKPAVKPIVTSKASGKFGKVMGLFWQMIANLFNVHIYIKLFWNSEFAVKTKTWVRAHKPHAFAIGFLLIAAGMWGSVTLYRKMSTVGTEKGDQKILEQASAVAVNVMQVAPAPFQDVLTAVGTVAGGSEIELRFQTEGNLASLYFKEGETIKAGQVIAQLDQTQVQIKLERAKAEFFRYEKLYALGGVSKSALDEARIQYEYAQSELNKTILRASQTGILGDKGVEVGEFITPQKKVGTLVSLNTVLVRIGVIEKDINKIFPGQPVTAKVDSYPDLEFKGKVENISPLIQGQSKTLSVEARMPNDGKLLLPGMFARVKIIIYEKDDAIAVPNDALEKTEAGYQVYIVGKDNKAEVRPVTVNYVALTNSVVSEGLQLGDQVIIQKPQELQAGSPVKVIQAEGMGGPAGQLGDFGGGE